MIVTAAVVQAAPVPFDRERTLEKVRALAADAAADLLVCVGGGSTTGLAKAVALTNGLPIVAVPTTYAGSEVTEVWGLTERGTKTTGRAASVLPRAVVYDATLTVGLPVDLSVASGLNAVAHCVDSLWAPAADPVDAALAGEGLRLLGEGLPGVVADPTALEGRERVLLGAYLAAVAFASAGSGLHHKVCHVLGGMFGLPHAQTHAVVLPHVLALNAPHAPEASARVEQALGGGDSVTALCSLHERLGAPVALRDLGMPADGIDAAVEAVVASAPAGNPAPVTSETVRGLVQRAWDGAAPSPGA